uniref:Uncharacterized protein n=1 Tax=Romanomermis culicivorax TaxID=13658 RepID=A0A915K6N8_ROMCU
LRDSVNGVFGCQPIRNLVASSEEQGRLLSSRQASNNTVTPIRSATDNRVHPAKDDNTVVYGSVDKSENEEYKKQWIIMASIIDKACFVGFLITFV